MLNNKKVQQINLETVADYKNCSGGPIGLPEYYCFSTIVSLFVCLMAFLIINFINLISLLQQNINRGQFVMNCPLT